MRTRKLPFSFLAVLLLFLLCACNSNGVMETIESPLPSASVAENITFEPGPVNPESNKEEINTSIPIASLLPEKTESDEPEQCCTLSVRCDSVLKNMDKLSRQKIDLIPTDGVILPKETLAFLSGDSVFDVLYRTLKEKGIHIEFVNTPMYNSVYVEGIANLYEFDCGELSGWMYRVNGWYPNYGCSRYQLADGEKVEWRYTCDLGNDVGREGTW
jgi:hypothetical protein